jgi:hypothetical protein
VALFCAVLTASSGNVQAQSLSGSIHVTPAVAPENQQRTITFSGVGRNGCTPVAGPIKAEPALDPKVITIELLYPPALGPCTQALTPYETTFAFTPRRNGTLVILAKFGNQIVGVGSLNVGAAQPSGAINLSGVWLDWSRPASIVHLSQSDINGSIAGIVGAYKPDGSPTWWLVHSSSRTGDNTYQARVSEYVAEELRSCTPAVPFGFCDGLFVKEEKYVGVMQITVQSKDVIELRLSPECFFTCNPGHFPAYSGVLSRFVH